MDHAATTPVDQRVQDAMAPFWTENFGNAGGLYEEGRRAKDAMQNSRETIAKLIGAKSDEIIFTSGGTESDNLAVFGVANAALQAAARASENSLAPSRNKSELNSATARPHLEFPSAQAQPSPRPHVITTKFEHHAVLTPCEQLAREGFDVTFLDVGADGIVNLEDVRKVLRPETVLVSIMYANNEIGTIQPIAEIGKIIKEYRLKKGERFSERVRASEPPQRGLSASETESARLEFLSDSRIQWIGIKRPPEELKKRIHKRLTMRLPGIIREVKKLHNPPTGGGLSWKRLFELGLEYRYASLYLRGKISKFQLTDQLNSQIWHYAKRQMTWFKKNKEIRWISSTKMWYRTCTDIGHMRRLSR